MRSIFLILIVLSGIIGFEALNFECTLKKLSGAWGDSYESVCDAFNVNITEKSETVTSVNFESATKFKGSAHKMLYVATQTMNYFPEDLGKFLPEIEELYVYNSQLKELNKKDLAQFQKLKKLYTYNNKIQYFLSDLFEENLDIQKIYFYSETLLKFVGSNILTPLKKLEYAYFYSCGCIHMSTSAVSTAISSLRSGCFNQFTQDLIEEVKSKDEKLKSLSTIYHSNAKQLTTCALNIQDSSILQKTFNLKCINKSNDTCEVVDFSVNLLGQKINRVLIENSDQTVTKLVIDEQNTLFLPSNIAEKFPKLTEISITKSGFSQFDNETFAGLSELTALKISKNKIVEIPAKSFTDNVELLQMDLSYNEISHIEDFAFSSLVKLIELNLQNNLLTYVNAEIFSNLKSLQSLSLKQNKLSILLSKSFFALPKLSKVDISNNVIEKLSGNLLSARNKITEFYATGNNLNVIEQKLVKRLSNAKIIDLRGNDCVSEIVGSAPGNITFESLHTKSYLRCSEDSDENADNE